MTSKSTVIPSKPHFFQPLIPSFQENFLIPVSFFKYLKKERERNKFELRSQGGKIWPVKINGRRFEDGWKQFVQDHELQIGDFVVFRHERGLVFEVKVFDRSTCVRDYVPAIVVKEEEEDHEVHEENLPEDSSTTCGKQLEKEKRSMNTKLKAKAKAKASSSNGEQNGPKYPPTPTGKKLEKQKKRLKEKDSSSVLQHPNCVIKLTHDSMKKPRLYIAREFARRLGLPSRSCSIILKDEEEQCFHGQLKYEIPHRKLFIGAGWSAFRAFHKLKAGDSLVIDFNFLKGSTPVFKLHRLKERLAASQISKSSGSGLKEHPAVPQVAKVSAFRLQEHPEDQLMQKSSLVSKESSSGTSKACSSSSSVIQRRFFVAKVKTSTTLVSKLNRESCKVVLVNQEGRSWPARLWNINNSNEQFHIADGWDVFRLANNLNPGKSFVFEFIENEHGPVFKICEFKANQKGGKNQEVVASSSMEKPHFYVTMQASHFQNMQLMVPKKFASRNGLDKCSAVTIKNEKGSSWIVSTRLDKTNRLYMANGWFDFVKENGIQEGHVFMLELVNQGNMSELKYYAPK